MSVVRFFIAIFVLLFAISCFAGDELEKGGELSYMKGLSWAYGNDGVVDREKACDYFGEAAKLDHSDAQVEYAQCYRSGIGREKNDNKAVYWLERSISQNNVKGMFLLSSMYLLNEKYKSKRGLGLKLLRRAYSNGSTDSAFLLGVLYHKGLSVEKHQELAMKYYKESAGNGSIYAQVLLYKIYQNGCYGVHANQKKSKFWLDKAINNERYSGGMNFVEKILENLKNNKLGLSEECLSKN